MIYAIIAISLLVMIAIVFVVVKLFFIGPKKGATNENEDNKQTDEEQKYLKTQDELPFDDIRKGVVILKNGTFLKIMEVPSVNTQLMEPEEKENVREVYGEILNSLNFRVQFYRQSRLVDINEYLKKLEDRKKIETQELVVEGLEAYIRFVTELVKENSLQTKKDYVVISYVEESKRKIKNDPNSLSKYRKNGEHLEINEEDQEFYQKEKRFEKAYKILTQRENVLEKQIRRLGINPKTLDDKEIYELLYTTYNRDRAVYQSMRGKDPKDFFGLYVKGE